MSTVREISNFAEEFERIKEVAPNGVEIWRASSLMKLLGYREWRNFEPVIYKSMNNFNGIINNLAIQNGIKLESLSSTSTRGFDVNFHYLTTTKQINRNNQITEYPDYYLTRLACYAVAMEADNRKPEVVLAKQYLLVLANKGVQDYLQYIENQQRIDFRGEMSRYENSLEHTYADHGVRSSQFGYVKSQGDAGFYNNPNGTSAVKKELGIPNNQTLYDYMPFETMVYKAMANIDTKYGIINKNLTGVDECASEAFSQNKVQREKMKDTTGYFPEETMPVERLGTTKKNMQKINQNVVKNAIEQHLPEEVDPRVYNLIFSYLGQTYTLGHWCYLNNIDPSFILTQLDNRIPFEQAIFMRPNGKISPMIIFRNE